MRESRWLALVVLAYVFLAAATSVIVPLGEAPDEIDHFRFVQALSFEGSLPVMQPVAAENVTMEANQPPLYYALGAWVTAPVAQAAYVDPHFVTCFLFETNAPGRQHLYVHDSAEAFPWSGAVLAFHLVRLLSVMLGAVTVVLAYVLGRLLAPGRAGIGLLSAAILAFNPQFIFITASVNNDVLTTLLGAATVVVALDLVRGGGSGGSLGRPFYARVGLLGVLLGLGALTKLALFALWPAALLAVVYAVWRSRSAGRRVGDVVLPLLMLAVPPLLLAGWWYVRGQLLYGDPVAWDVHLAAKGNSVLRLEPFGWADLLEFGRFHFQSYWALFGWLNIAAPFWLYVVLIHLVVGGMAGIVVYAIGLWHRPRVWDNIVAFLIAVLAVAGIYASLLRYIQTINWSGYQGRLAYAVAAPIAALLALGWVTLIDRIRLPSALSRVLVAGMAALAVFTIGAVLVPAYPRPLIYQPDAALPRTCIHFESGLTVEAYEAPREIRPNERVDVRLHFYSYTRGDGIPIVLQLLAADGRVLAETSAGSGPWQPNALTSVMLSLTVPEDAPPSDALWRVGALGADGAVQPASDVYGRTLPEWPVLAEVRIREK